MSRKFRHIFCVLLCLVMALSLTGTALAYADTTQRPVLLLSMYHNDRDFFGLKPLLESWDVGYRFKVFKGLDYGICLETMLIAEVL